MKNLKYILDQEKQPIEVDKSEHSTGALATTFHKHAGEANPNDLFVYGP